MILLLLLLMTIVNSLVLQPKTVNNGFIFSCCQSGAEKALKHDVASNHPYLTPAFSRPGLLTFKIKDNTELSSGFHIDSAFARTSGISLGSLSSSADIISQAIELRSQVDKPLRLHVYQRDEPGASSEHPLAIDNAKQKIASLTNELLKATDSDRLWSSVNNQDNRYNSLIGVEQKFIAQDDDYVFQVVVPTGKYEADMIFVGYHMHQRSENHTPYPGGNPLVYLPPDAPSRAYLKMCEAMIWSNAKFSASDTVVEIGSAPGGGSWALLQQGLSVIGIDPCPADRQHAHIISNHPRFRHIRAYADRVNPSQLCQVEWIVCDANQPPNTLLPVIDNIVRSMWKSLKGVFIILKFNNDNWKDVSLLSAFLEDIKCMGMTHVQAKQLSSNRQEVLVFATTNLFD